MQISGNSSKADWDGQQVDLDQILLSDDLTPGLVSAAFPSSHVPPGDPALFHSILDSTLSPWLLGLDFLRGFPEAFRSRVLDCLPAFPAVVVERFAAKVQNSPDRDLAEALNRAGNASGLTELTNPLGMLGNPRRGRDLDILAGRRTLAKDLLDCVEGYLADGDRRHVDFSRSLFLPELLCPVMFRTLSEGLQLVLLSGFGDDMRSLTRPKLALGGVSRTGSQLNLPRVLARWAMSSGSGCSPVVRSFAWRQLDRWVRAEIDRGAKPRSRKAARRSPPGPTPLDQNFDPTRVSLMDMDLGISLRKRGWDLSTPRDWMDRAEGLFESFEMDCSLHGLQAVEFLPEMLFRVDYYPMLGPMLDFQSPSERSNLLDLVSSCVRVWD